MLWSAIHGYERMIRRLAVLSPDLVNTSGPERVTALILAVQYQRMDTVQLLLDLGADPFRIMDNGMNAMHVACKMGHIDMVRLLSRRVSRLATRSTRDGWPPVLLAASAGQTEIVEALLNAGANVNDATPVIDHEHGGDSALHCAMRRGHIRTAELLVARGADVNSATRKGHTPLIEAAEKGHTRLTALMLGSGADVDAVTSSGKTALYSACEQGHVGVVPLLLAAGSDCNAVTHRGKTALYVVAEKGFVSIARHILKYANREDVLRPTKYGTTPMYVAQRCPDARMKELLLEFVLPGHRGGPSTTRPGSRGSSRGGKRGESAHGKRQRPRCCCPAKLESATSGNKAPGADGSMQVSRDTVPALPLSSIDPATERPCGRCGGYLTDLPAADDDLLDADGKVDMTRLQGLSRAELRRRREKERTLQAKFPTPRFASDLVGLHTHSEQASDLTASLGVDPTLAAPTANPVPEYLRLGTSQRGGAGGPDGTDGPTSPREPTEEDIARMLAKRRETEAMAERARLRLEKKRKDEEERKAEAAAAEAREKRRREAALLREQKRVSRKYSSRAKKREEEAEAAAIARAAARTERMAKAEASLNATMHGRKGKKARQRRTERKVGSDEDDPNDDKCADSADEAGTTPPRRGQSNSGVSLPAGPVVGSPPKETLDGTFMASPKTPDSNSDRNTEDNTPMGHLRTPSTPTDRDVQAARLRDRRREQRQRRLATIRRWRLLLSRGLAEVRSGPLTGEQRRPYEQPAANVRLSPSAQHRERDGAGDPPSSPIQLRGLGVDADGDADGDGDREFTDALDSAISAASNERRTDGGAELARNADGDLVVSAVGVRSQIASRDSSVAGGSAQIAPMRDGVAVLSGSTRPPEDSSVRAGMSPRAAVAKPFETQQTVAEKLASLLGDAAAPPTRIAGRHPSGRERHRGRASLSGPGGNASGDSADEMESHRRSDAKSVGGIQGARVEAIGRAGGVTGGAPQPHSTRIVAEQPLSASDAKGPSGRQSRPGANSTDAAGRVVLRTVSYEAPSSDDALRRAASGRIPAHQAALMQRHPSYGQGPAGEMRGTKFLLAEKTESAGAAAAKRRARRRAGSDAAEGDGASGSEAPAIVERSKQWQETKAERVARKREEERKRWERTIARDPLLYPPTASESDSSISYSTDDDGDDADVSAVPPAPSTAEKAVEEEKRDQERMQVAAQAAYDAEQRATAHLVATAEGARLQDEPVTAVRVQAATAKVAAAKVETSAARAESRARAHASATAAAATAPHAIYNGDIQEEDYFSDEEDPYRDSVFGQLREEELPAELSEAARRVYERRRRLQEQEESRRRARLTQNLARASSFQGTSAVARAMHTSAAAVARNVQQAGLVPASGHAHSMLMWRATAPSGAMKAGVQHPDGAPTAGGSQSRSSAIGGGLGTPAGWPASQGDTAATVTSGASLRPEVDSRVPALPLNLGAEHDGIAGAPPAPDSAREVESARGSAPVDEDSPDTASLVSPRVLESSQEVSVTHVVPTPLRRGAGSSAGSERETRSASSPRQGGRRSAPSPTVVAAARSSAARRAAPSAHAAAPPSASESVGYGSILPPDRAESKDGSVDSRPVSPRRLGSRAAAFEGRLEQLRRNQEEAREALMGRTQAMGAVLVDQHAERTSTAQMSTESPATFPMRPNSAKRLVSGQSASASLSRKSRSSATTVSPDENVVSRSRSGGHNRDARRSTGSSVGRTGGHNATRSSQVGGTPVAGSPPVSKAPLRPSLVSLGSAATRAPKGVAPVGWVPAQ